MDGIHDLGGKQGHGAIDINEPEEAFHQRYDGVGWTINQTTRAPSVSIDFWRHIRELTPPVDYLTRPYFDQWVMTQLISMILSGQLQLEEVLEGKAQVLDQPVLSMTTEDVFAATKKAAYRFDRPTQLASKFKIGEVIQTRNYSVSGHTRLPGYAQGKSGVVHALRGAHLLPDLGALRIEQAQHLYTIEFQASDLWPQDKEVNHQVYIDLWESYFV